MLKKLTFSQNNGVDISENIFSEGLNILKSPDIYSRFAVLNNLNDYSVLSSSSQASGDFTELEFEKDDRTYFLTLYLDSKVYEFYNDLDEDQNLSDFFKPKTIKYADYENIFLDRLKEFSFDNAEEEPQENGEDEQSNLQKEKEDKVGEINKKIGVLEKELDDSKQYDSISEELGKAEKDIEKSTEKLQEYEIAQQKVNEAKLKKEQLGIINRLDFALFEKDLKTLNAEIKIKEEQIASLSGNQNSFKYEIGKSRSPLIFGVVIALDVLITLLTTLLVGTQALVIGGIVAIVLSIWHFLPSNESSPEQENSTSMNFNKDFGLEMDLLHRAKEDLLKIVGCSSESDYYEKKAQLQACNIEIAHLDKLVSAKFQDTNVEDSKKQKIELELKINELRNKLSGQLNEAKLTSEIYLKKRRDLDMLKMEKIRAESEYKGKEVVKKSSNPVKKGNVLSSKLAKIKDQILLTSVSVEDGKIKAETMEDLYLACLANSLLLIEEKNTIYPALLEDPFVFVSNFEKSSAILDFFKKRIELILYVKHSDYDSLGKIVNLNGNQNESTDQNNFDGVAAPNSSI